MFDRFKRLLSGAAPSALAAPTPPAEPPPPGRLDWITGDTPHRFRTWLDDGSQRDAALEILSRRLGMELTVDAVDEPDGRVRLDVASTFKQGAAYLRPLNVLRAEGVRVRGFERLDLFAELEAGELDRLAAAYETKAYDAMLRRRVDALTGEPILRRALEERRHVKRGYGWEAILANAAHTTPGIDGLLLQTAIDERNPDLAVLLVGLVAARGTMADLVSWPFEPSADDVVTLARKRGRLAEAAFRVAAGMRRPLPAELTAVLCRVARRGDLAAFDAVRALRKAEPTADVRTALELALESTVADVSGAAMSTLGELLGTDARPYWQAWLASTSAPNRMAGEEMIGMYGNAEDVPEAAEHLHKIIRRKSTISWQPPRGSEIVHLLARHRDMPEAKAAFDDLAKRWPRLPEELQQWLRTHYPDLAPAEAPTTAAEAVAEPDDSVEPPLSWPLPSIERKGREFHLGFWDTDMTDVRDQFEGLVAAHPAITILDGDREWATYGIDAGDPEGLIGELWSQAQVRAHEHAQDR